MGYEARKNKGRKKPPPLMFLCTMMQDKETRNKMRYREVSYETNAIGVTTDELDNGETFLHIGENVIETLYVSKGLLPEDMPERIAVLVVACGPEEIPNDLRIGIGWRDAKPSA